MNDNSYLRELERLFCNLLENQKTNTIEFINPISTELFNFIYNNNLLNRITSQSLTISVPEECLDKIKDRIDWGCIMKRKELSMGFIKENIKKIDLDSINHKQCLPFELMLENIKANRFTTILLITEKILESEKYTYEEFIELFNNIIFSSKSDNTGYRNKYNQEQIQCLITGYIKIYYQTASPSNLLKFKEFMKIFYESKYIDIDVENNYYFKYLIVDLLRDKLNVWDLEYLIEDNIICYYMGKNKLTPESEALFYEYRHKLLAPNSNIKKLVNPFISISYTPEQLEDMINITIKSGIPGYMVWNYVSDLCLSIKTPLWFWKKHKTKINWQFATEKIINDLDQNDKYQSELFIQWIIDNDTDIFNGFMRNIPIGYIIPEILIAYFVDGKNNNIFLPKIMKLQKLSLSLLNYLAENDVLTDNDWLNISSYQLMDPKFIEVYEKKLDWCRLKFNITFVKYNRDMFHRLPVMDNANKFIWMTEQEKADELEKMKIQFSVLKENGKTYFQFQMTLRVDVNHFSQITTYHTTQNEAQLYKTAKLLRYTNDKMWRIRNPSNNSYNISQKRYEKIVFNYDPELMKIDNKFINVNTHTISINNKDNLALSLGNCSTYHYHTQNPNYKIESKYLSLIKIDYTQQQTYHSGSNNAFIVFAPLGEIHKLN